MKSFLELAQQRRSYRKYTAQPIEQEKIEQILQAALMSPASKRCNPWEFVVVTDHEVLNKMAGCRTYGSQMLTEAAAGILVCVDASLTDTWQCDGAIAAEHMLLEASDLGIGACWVQVYGRYANEENTVSAEQLLRELTGVPDSLNILCIISLGYKNEERKPREIDKLQYEKVHYGQY
ncbi:MAG: nitroreductase family protein [Paludibacteraceae bacterium]|nr:nitroreductase family protein [Paludibacteraceae bacterium]